jgi:RNA polymerase sigma-70 factor, ECF subfamily
MPLLSENDEELMRRVVHLRDQHAFRVLVDRHKAFGLTLSQKILRDELLAEEALQDAFLRVWRSSHTFNFTSRFRTWFYRILHNVSLTKLKQQGAEQTTEIEEIHATVETTPDLDTSTLILTSIEKLPVAARTVITLFYLQELSIEEISEVCEMPVGTVKTHLFRGREKLRNDVALKEHYYG